MKAILLAAGFGTRLHPLTLKTPKCLIKVNDVPMLEHWIRKLELCPEISEIFINTHHLANLVTKFVNDLPSNKKITIFHEEKLLGTGGTVRAVCNSNKLNEDILVIHVDNYFEGTLQILLEHHYNRPQKCVLTALTHETDRPESCGIFEVNQLGIVTNFWEKSKFSIGFTANSAIYIFSLNVLQMIIENDEINDISVDLLPKLIGSIYTVPAVAELIDIGTFDSLEKANSLKNA